MTDPSMKYDIILLNTCSIRESPGKVFSELGQWRPLKERIQI
jgi:tRNA A37 methylthiotransferase MiaB